MLEIIGHNEGWSLRNVVLTGHFECSRYREIQRVTDVKSLCGLMTEDGGMDDKYREITKIYDGYNVIARSNRLKPEGTHIVLRILKNGKLMLHILDICRISL